MKTLLTIIGSVFVASSGYAASVKCKVIPTGSSVGEEKILEILPPDSIGQLTKFGNFSLTVESEQNGTPEIILIDSLRGALATARMNLESGEGEVEVSVVDSNWFQIPTAKASCKLL